MGHYVNQLQVVTNRTSQYAVYAMALGRLPLGNALMILKQSLEKIAGVKYCPRILIQPPEFAARDLAAVGAPGCWLQHVHRRRHSHFVVWVAPPELNQFEQLALVRACRGRACRWKVFLPSTLGLAESAWKS